MCQCKLALLTTILMNKSVGDAWGDKTQASLIIEA